MLSSRLKSLGFWMPFIFGAWLLGYLPIRIARGFPLLSSF